MALRVKIILLFCFFGCTSNPFWKDNPTKKLNISGKVIANNRETDVPVYIWIEDLDISGYSDSSNNFSIDISNLENGDGSFSGIVKVFYYIHNYQIQYSMLHLTDGRLSSIQTDFDQDGNLLKTIILDKLVSFDMSFGGDVIDNIWRASNGDTLIVNFKIDIKDRFVSLISNVKVITDPHQYIPTGMLFFSEKENKLYYNQDNIGFLQKYDFDPNVSIEWDYICEPQNDMTIPEEYYIRPFIIIQQHGVPDALIQSLNVQDQYNITLEYFNLPIDIIQRSILLQ